ncbi:siroheme decarboxylase subunit beta [Achromobacter marplatensis]|uniref:siroheme decarboxylase subunit beta n=1 Tax=Achromobacter marplatensis TaxID=470868 RepID=UPI0039F6F1A2
MASELSASALRLLDGWQHGFPLTPRPFALLAAGTGLQETDVLEHFQRWLANGVLSRIGPVLHQSCFASALVGMRVPPARLDSVAAHVTALSEVNHNYARDHAVNLWFVAACPTAPLLHSLLEDIRRKTGCDPMALPMEAAYHIDLGFSLSAAPKTVSAFSPRQTMQLPAPDSPERALLYSVQHGISLCVRPYRLLAQRVGMTESDVLRQLEQWLRQGLFRRFGVIVRHRKLGYGANAMCVWNVDDAIVDQLGDRLGREPGVTLCYRRSRRPPDWTYNLFCMIHGKERASVLSLRGDIATRLQLDAWPHATLFSTRCFKQRGARILQPKAAHA